MSREEEIELAWAQARAIRLSRAAHLTPELRDRLAEAQNWRCCWRGCRMDGCGAELSSPSFEHVIPKSLGGTDDIDNVAISCVACNTERMSIDWQTWLKQMDRHAA